MGFGHGKTDAYRAAIEYAGVCGAMSAEENAKAKTLLDRIVAMLTKLGQRGYSIQEDGAKYGQEIIDTDSDTDPDTDERRKKRKRMPTKSFHLTANRRR